MSTTDPMTQERLDAIQGRVDTATKGPWMEGTRCVFTEDYEHAIVSDSLVEAPDMSPYGEAVQNPADVALIAHAPQDLAALLAEVKRLRARPTVDEDMVERAKHAFGAATARVSSVPLGMSEDMFIDSVGLQHQHAIRAALNAALGTGEGS